MTTYEALKAMILEGKGIRYEDWEKGEYIYAKNGKVFEENGEPYMVGVWELKEPPKLVDISEAIEALRQGKRVRNTQYWDMAYWVEMRDGKLFSSSGNSVCMGVDNLTEKVWEILPDEDQA